MKANKALLKAFKTMGLPPPVLPKGSAGHQPKYKNKKVKHGDLTFASKLELNCWLILEGMERDKEISFLRRQVSFAIVVNDQHICRYVADYVFIHNGKQVVADAKGFATPEFKLKKKLLMATRGVEIVEWHSLRELHAWKRGGQ